MDGNHWVGTNQMFVRINIPSKSVLIRSDECNFLFDNFLVSKLFCLFLQPGALLDLTGSRDLGWL